MLIRSLAPRWAGQSFSLFYESEISLFCRQWPGSLFESQGCNGWSSVFFMDRLADPEENHFVQQVPFSRCNASGYAFLFYLYFQGACRNDPDVWSFTNSWKGWHHGLVGNTWLTEEKGACCFAPNYSRML